MADNKTKRGAADRRQVAGGEGYQVNYFARKHGITKDQAEGLIKKAGNDREKLNAVAAKLKYSSHHSSLDDSMWGAGKTPSAGG